MKKLPTKSDVLKWITENPALTSKRDIAKAFGIKGAARIDLKKILKELEAEGHLQKRKKTFRDPDSLPPVSVFSVMPPDEHGDIFLAPLEWEGRGVAPKVLLIESERSPAVGAGERILGKVQRVSGEDHAYAARIIRKLETHKRAILGIFRAGAEGGRVVPIDKKESKEWLVPLAHADGAKDGELVEAEQTEKAGRMGLPKARITQRLGDPTAPKSVSLIAIHEHGIPDAFPQDVIRDAELAAAAPATGREDLRDLPLVTIDPPDARDHDDAVWAELDSSSSNPGGYILWVAIADVAHYVPPNSALDREAWKRGNSSYFPDRVVPMLPDQLSGDLCSLHENVDRACLAVAMTIDADGNKISHKFMRAIMRSHASLSYADVQSAYDGDVSDKCAPLMESVITPLYGAYAALKKARSARGPLNLDLPERKIVAAYA